jgi:hypothetical protein
MKTIFLAIAVLSLTIPLVVFAQAPASLAPGPPPTVQDLENQLSQVGCNAERTPGFCFTKAAPSEATG